MQPLWEIVSHIWPKAREIKLYHGNASFLCSLRTLPPPALGKDAQNCSFCTGFLVWMHIYHVWSLSRNLTWVLVFLGDFQMLCQAAPSEQWCETRETGNGLNTLTTSFSFSLFFAFFFFSPKMAALSVCITPIVNVFLLLYSQFGVSSIHMLIVVQCLTFSQIDCKDCYRQWNTRINSFYFRSDKLLSIQTTCNACYWPLLFLFMAGLPSVLLS